MWLRFTPWPAVFEIQGGNDPIMTLNTSLSKVTCIPMRSYFLVPFALRPPLITIFLHFKQMPKRKKKEEKSEWVNRVYSRFDNFSGTRFTKLNGLIYEQVPYHELCWQSQAELKTAGRRMKQIEIWDLWVVVKCSWSTLQMAVTRKRLAIEWNTVKFGTRGVVVTFI